MYTSEKSHIELIKDTFVDKGSILINWIGQSGFVLKTFNGTVLCIDPYYSNSIERYEGRDCRRMWYNKFKIEFFKPDVVLCSHDHLDHTDPETIPLLAAYSDAMFYAPQSSCSHMRRMKISEDRMMRIERNKLYEYKDIKIKTVYANHTEDSLGFIIIIDSIKIYFTGDTSLDSKLYKIKDENIDIVVACINGKYNNLNIQEAIELHKNIAAKQIIPMHYGLIPSNTVNEIDFSQACAKSGADYAILKTETDYFIHKDKGITIKERY